MFVYLSCERSSRLTELREFTFVLDSCLCTSSSFGWFSELFSLGGLVCLHGLSLYECKHSQSLLHDRTSSDACLVAVRSKQIAARLFRCIHSNLPAHIITAWYGRQFLPMRRRFRRALSCIILLSALVVCRLGVSKHDVTLCASSEFYPKQALSLIGSTSLGGWYYSIISLLDPF